MAKLRFEHIISTWSGHLVEDDYWLSTGALALKGADIYLLVSLFQLFITQDRFVTLYIA